MLNFALHKCLQLIAIAARITLLLAMLFTHPTYAVTNDGEDKALTQPFFSSLYSRPIYTGNLSLTAYTEYAYDATNPSNTGSNTYTKSVLDSNLYFSPELYLDLDVLVDTSSGVETQQNYVIDNGQVIFGKVAIRYENDDLWIAAGRDAINFSMARRYAAGVWGTSLMMREVGVLGKAGFAGAVKFNKGSWGNHALYGSIFMADNSFLSASFGKSSDPSSLTPGGPSNTGKLNNYGLAIDGLNISALPKFRYHLSGIVQQTQSLQAKGVNIPTQYLSSEYRYATAIVWDKININHDVVLSPLFEYNGIHNRNGISGFNANYYTGSALFGYKQWSLGGSYTLWRQAWPNATLDAASINIPSGNSTVPSLKYGSATNNQGQVSIGYLFSNGVRVDLGYRNENKQGLSVQSVGLAVKYNIPFSFGF